jgi:hypothetical protein
MYVHEIQAQQGVNHQHRVTMEGWTHEMDLRKCVGIVY